MRPLIALVIAATLFGGTYAYTAFVDRIKHESVVFEPRYSTGEFTVVIARTFDCQAADGFGGQSLSLRFGGQVLLAREDLIPKSETIVVNPLTGVQQLANELYVEAQVKHGDDLEMAEFGDHHADSETANHAMRVTVLRDRDVIADRTFWLQPGSDSIAGTIAFNTPLEDQSEGH